MKSSISQKELKKLLDYNPETGLFNRKIDLANGVKRGDAAGHLHSSGYIQISINKILHKAHHLAWIFSHGNINFEIDHINHDRTDNKLINLRDVTHQENCQNKQINKNNTSGVCGVGWHKVTSKWAAKIKVHYKETHLGVYADKFEAICARKSAENKHGFHKNHGDYERGSTR